MDLNITSQYMDYVQPSFAPPSEWFGIVWTFLYVVIAISFGYVFIQAYNKKIPFMVALPFILNLIFNFAFTTLQFGFNNLILASIDIVLVLATIIWSMVAIWKYSKPVAYAQIPYLLWVAFATVLQLTITYLNV